jgi:hypothetical protein
MNWLLDPVLVIKFCSNAEFILVALPQPSRYRVMAALSALIVLNSRTQGVLVGKYRSTTPKWGRGSPMGWEKVS